MPNGATGETKRSWYLPELLIFCTALVVRLVCLRDFTEIPFFAHLIVDSKAYDAWGMRVAGGQWLGTRAFYQAPLYPYFVGLFYWIVGHHHVWLRVFQAVLGALSCVVVARTGQRFFDRGAGLLAGWMLALYAPAVFFDVLIQKSVLDVLLLSLALLVLARARESGRAAAALGTGALLGLLTLTRENALLIMPVAAWWLGRPSITDARYRWGRALVVVVGFALVLLPVYLRNAYFGARTGLTTYNVGTSFYIGNGKPANGGYVPVAEERGTTELEETDARQIAEAARGRKLTPDEISRYWWARAVSEIAAEPRRWLRLLGQKAKLVTNHIEVIDTDDIYFYEQFSPTLRILNAFWNFGLLFPLACVGVVLNWQTRGRWGVLALMALVMTASLVLFYVVARYRHALVPLLTPLAGAGVVEAYRRLRRGRELVSTSVVRRQNALAAFAGVASFGVSHVPLLTKDAQLGTSYFNAAGAAQAQGHYDAAAQYYELARKAGRRQPATELNYGALLNQLGRYEDALRAFADAEREGGDAALIAENRATSFLGLGKADAALEQIKKAEKQTTGSAELENFRGVVLQKLERNAEAEEAFRNALQQKPGYTFAYIHLIQQLAKAGDTTGVQALMRQAEISGADMKLLRDAAKPNHE